MIWWNERCLRVDVLPGEDEKNGEDNDFDVAKGKRQRRSATCPFSNTALAVVGQRRSRLNSVRHADGSPTATCILYAVRVRRTVSLKSMDVDVEKRSSSISTPKGRPQESMVLNQGILASPTVCSGEVVGIKFPIGETVRRCVFCPTCVGRHYQARLRKINTILPTIYFDTLVIWIFAIINLPIAQTILPRISAVANPNLDILVAEHIPFRALLAELLEQGLEFLQRHSLVYDDVNTHARRAKSVKHPRLILCLYVVNATKMLDMSLIGIEDFVVGVHVAWVFPVADLLLSSSSAVANSDLDIFVPDHSFASLRCEEAVEQRFELLHRYPSVHEDDDVHARLAELEDDLGSVFCVGFVVTAHTPEVGLVGIDAFPVAVGAAWIIH